MSNPQNETAVRRLFDVLLEQSNSPSDSELQQIVTSDWVNNDQAMEGALGYPLQGYGGARELHDFWKPFSDTKVTIEDMFSDADWVACHIKVRGKHTGNFLGTPPTGKSFEMTATCMFRCRDGKVAANIVNPDAMGMLIQLGVIQMPAQRKAA